MAIQPQLIINLAMLMFGHLTSTINNFRSYLRGVINRMRACDRIQDIHFEINNLNVILCNAIDLGLPVDGIINTINCLVEELSALHDYINDPDLYEKYPANLVGRFLR